MVSMRNLAALSLCLTTMAASSALAESRTALQVTPAAQATPSVAAIAPPPTPVAFETALARAATELLSKAKPDGKANRIEVVIDPLIDAATGAQSEATLFEQKRIAELIRADARYRLLPFTVDSLLRRPVVLVGTFTAVNNAGTPGGPRDAYRICLAFADLRSNTIISKGVARALPEGVDPTPAPFFRDSPVYAKDPATEAYVKSCQGVKVGDPVDDHYTDRVLAAAKVNEGIEAYNAGRYRAALGLYESALKMPGGEQLRVFTGIYLAAFKLGRTRLAMQAFGRMIDFGLQNGDRLAMKILFKPGSTQFYADPATPAPYRAWIGKLAQRTATNRACLEVVGHTSATGLPGINERLSTLRADFIKEQVEAEESSLEGRLLASGRGSRELIVGTGRDDPSDALDRRVEFRVVRCTG